MTFTLFRAHLSLHRRGRRRWSLPFSLVTTIVTGCSQGACGRRSGRVASLRGYSGVDSARIVAVDELNRLQQHTRPASYDIALRGEALFSEPLDDLVPLQRAGSKWQQQKAAKEWQETM
jgi:hypothetical protein